MQSSTLYSSILEDFSKSCHPSLKSCTIGWIFNVAHLTSFRNWTPGKPDGKPVAIQITYFYVLISDLGILTPKKNWPSWNSFLTCQHKHKNLLFDPSSYTKAKLRFANTLARTRQKSSFLNCNKKVGISLEFVKKKSATSPNWCAT